MKQSRGTTGGTSRLTRWLSGLAMIVMALAVTAPVHAGKVGKLQKKLAKVENAIEVQEAKVDAAETELPQQEAALVVAQADLVAAQALPQETKAEKKARKKAIKAANKAVKKASKRINKLMQLVAKWTTSLSKKYESVEQLEAKIDELVIGGLGETGEVGVDGLELPEQVSLLAAQVEDDPTPDGPEVQHKGGGSLAAGVGIPTNSDYYTDEAHTWVYDPSMESLDSVNQILCMLRQTAYDVMVNEGAYLAQIDPNLCNEGVSVDGLEGEVEDVELWTVDSRREDEEADHVIGVWVPQEAGDGPGGDDPAATINARMVIIEEPSEENPFGLFAMDFEALPDDDPDGEPLYWGTLETADALAGYVGFTFYEFGEQVDLGFSNERAVHVNISPSGAGVAHVFETVTGDFGQGTQTEEGTWLLAFNDDFVLRQQDEADEACFSRSDFETSVWRYNFYESEGVDIGALVTRNSGFGIETEDGDYGWVGYNGLWLPDDAAVATGDTVTKNSFDAGDNPEQFTVLQAPGKLYRYSRDTLPLADIDGEVFSFWTQVKGSTWAQYEVVYDHGTGEFLYTGFYQPDGSITVIDPPNPVPVEFLGFLDMWSNSLGGSVVYVDGDSEVTFFEETVVSGNDPALDGDGTLELYGYLDPLATSISQQDAEDGNVFLPYAMNVNEPYEYLFERDDLTLYLDLQGGGFVVEPVGLADGVTYSTGPFDWGMRSGPLVTDTGALSDVYDVWEQDVFYVYETGPNPWNKQTALLDGEGDYVDFDPPLQFTYQHSTAADKNGSSEYDGKTFQLEFHGPGELSGIPYEPVDLDGDGNDDRWYPVFDIADGTLVGPPGDQFLIRAVEMEQRLASAPGQCTELNLGGAAILALPNGDTFEQPNLGDQPVLDGPPAVIAGVVQDDD